MITCYYKGNYTIRTTSEWEFHLIQDIGHTTSYKLIDLNISSTSKLVHPKQLFKTKYNGLTKLMNFNNAYVNIQTLLLYDKSIS